MINPFSNPSYLLPPLVTLVVSIILLVVVWRGTQRNFSTNLFCGFLSSVALWSVLLFGMRSSPDIHGALLWERGLPAVSYTTFLLYYHFTLAYTNTRGQRGILLAAYLTLVLIAALSPTDLIIERMRLEHYGYAPVVSPIVFVLAIGGLLLLGGGAYNLFKRYKTLHSYEERNRLLYLAIAVFFPLAGAMVDAFSNLPPVAIWSNLIFCIICSIAILKYHLLDIRVILRRSLAYLLVSLAIAMPYVGVIMLLNYILKARMEPWWVHAIIILLLAILLRPLYSWTQHLVDKLFYRDRYDYLKALQQFSQKAQSVINLGELSSTLTRLVSSALRTSSACLLLPSEGDNGLIIVSSTNLGSSPSGVVLRNRSPLIKWLKLKQRTLSSEELDIIPQLQSLSLRERSNLKQMAAKLFVPIQIAPGQLSGILVLGQKLSQQPYSSEDRQLLATLSNQMAIALENARLYSESQQEVRERKQAEKALERQQAYFQQLFDNSPDAIAWLDTADRFVSVNKGFETLFGYRAEEVKGKTALDLIVPKDRAGELASLSRARSSNKAIRRETVRKRKDDSLVDVSILSYPIRLGNKAVGAYVIHTDITERIKAEEAEKRMQQELYLSRRLAAIGELAAGVAHEINNPLTGVLGFAQRLLRKGTSEEISRDLEIIQSEAKRAAKIAQSLLTFARHREPKKEYSDINDIVQKTLELRSYELQSSNIEVITSLASSLPKVMVDFPQIQEVFLNIILNAEHAMNEAHGRGKLIIKTREIKDYARISFADDGPGIPSDKIDKVFDPFFTTREDRGGTGLGLSICHGIVTGHGGKIYTRSKPGGGTTFFVELPVAAEKIKENEVIGKEPARRSK